LMRFVRHACTRDGDLITDCGPSEDPNVRQRRPRRVSMRPASLETGRGLLRLRAHLVEAHRVIEAEKASYPIKRMRELREVSRCSARAELHD
jgi:hypothetical protein